MKSDDVERLVRGLLRQTLNTRNMRFLYHFGERRFCISPEMVYSSFMSKNLSVP